MKTVILLAFRHIIFSLTLKTAVALHFRVDDKKEAPCLSEVESFTPSHILIKLFASYGRRERVLYTALHLTVVAHTVCNVKTEAWWMMQSSMYNMFGSSRSLL